MKRIIAIVAIAALAACASQDDTVEDASSMSIDSAAAQPASVPQTSIPDGFTTNGAMQVFDARKAYDLTGDGNPETIVVHAEGARVDTAAVQLLILNAASDTLYRGSWNAQHYFHYEDRKGFTTDSANARVVAHLQRLLSDSSFTADGPSPRMQNTIPGGIDKDAIRYDLKEAQVRAKNSLTNGEPLTSPMYAELEKAPVTNAAIDSLAAELAKSPTFTYFAGGEITYTLAWSEARKRFVRIFACC